VSERPLLSDNPNDHDVLVLLVERFSSHMQTSNRALGRVEATLTSLDEKVGAQNGNVARLTERANTQDERWLQHGKEHKDEIETPLQQLTREQNEADIKRKFITTIIATFMAGIVAVPALYAAWKVFEELFS
jgi:hypothetical protein